MISIEMLDLSQYDPKTSIVVFNVNVGGLPAGRARKWLDRARERYGPIFAKRGYTCMFLPSSREEIGISVQMSSDVLEKLDIDLEELDPFDIARETI